MNRSARPYRLDVVAFLGGAVNAKRVSAVYNAVDAVQISEGYQGKIQYLFVISEGQSGGHGASVESDPTTTTNSSSTRRTFPRLNNALFVDSFLSGGDSTLSFKDGAGGEFGNIVMINVRGSGVKQERCLQGGTHVKPSWSGGGRGGGDRRDYLWFSKDNILFGVPDAAYLLDAGCEGLSEIDREDPIFLAIPPIPKFNSRPDPRPRVNSVVFRDVDTVPTGSDEGNEDGFFTQASFRGAFGPDEEDVWITGHSWLAAHNGLGAHLQAEVDVAALSSDDDGDMMPSRAVVITVCVLVPAVIAAFVGAVIVYYVRFKRVESKYQELLVLTDATAIGGHWHHTGDRPASGQGSGVEMSRATTAMPSVSSV